MYKRPDKLSQLFYMALFLSLSFGFFQGSSYAFPIVISSPTNISTSFHPLGTQPVIEGNLRDNLYRGISNKRIGIEVFHKGKTVMQLSLATDKTGHFKTRLDLKEGKYGVRVFFEGGDYLEGSEERFGINVELADLELAFLTSGELDMAMGKLNLSMSAKSVAGPAANVEINMRAGFVDFGLQKTNGEGIIKKTVASTRFPSQGFVELVGEFKGNKLYKPAKIKTIVFLYRSSKLDIVPAISRERASRGVIFSGKLTFDRRGFPGKEVKVEVLYEGEVVAKAKVKTSMSGNFRGFIEEEEIPDGEIRIRSYYDPSQGSRIEGALTTLVFTSPGRSGFLYLLAGLFILSVVSLIGLLITKFIKREKGQRKKPTVVKIPPIVPVSAKGISGVQKIPDKRVIQGVLWDYYQACPIEGGLIELLKKDEIIESRETSERGLFILGPLEPSKYMLVAKHRGHMGVQVPIRIPHRGQLDFFRLTMISVRDKLRETYENMLIEVAPDEELWNKLTPREVNRWLVDTFTSFAQSRGEVLADERLNFENKLKEILDSDSSAASKLVDAMTLLFEEVYYGPRDYDESMHELATQLVRRIKEILVRDEQIT